MLSFAKKCALKKKSIGRKINRDENTTASSENLFFVLLRVDDNRQTFDCGWE